MPLELSPRFRATELRRLALLTVPHAAILTALIAYGPTLQRLVPAPPSLRLADLVRWPDHLPQEAKTYAIGVVLLAMMVAASVRELRATVERLRHAQALARAGRVESLQVTRTVRTRGWLGMRERYRLELAPGTSRWSSLPQSEGGPCRAPGSRDRILALCSQDRRVVLLLSMTGYPLTRVPPVDPSIASPRRS